MAGGKIQEEQGERFNVGIILGGFQGHRDAEKADRLARANRWIDRIKADMGNLDTKMDLILKKMSVTNRPDDLLSSESEAKWEIPEGEEWLAMKISGHDTKTPKKTKDLYFPSDDAEEQEGSTNYFDRKLFWSV